MLRQVDFWLKTFNFTEANQTTVFRQFLARKKRMSEPLILLEAPRPLAMTHSPNRELLLDQIATTLKRRGLHSAALAVLEAGQPLAFVGSQVLWLAQPVLGLLWPDVAVSQLAKLMEDPAAVQALMQRLDADEVAV